MPQIPQYNRETRLNGAITPYEHYRIDENTSGASIGRAMQNASKGFDALGDAALKINQTFEEMKTLEFHNAVEQWTQSRLMDKENGYYLKTGKDAAGKTKEIMDDYDSFVSDWMQNNKLSKRNQARVQATSSYKRSRVLQGVTSHDLKQTQIWANNETNLGIDNSINAAVSDRNNPDGINTQVANVRQITRWQGETLGLDEESINTLERENVGKVYTAVLETKLQEGDLTARDFFEQNKNYIKADTHSKYLGRIKAEEDKYKSRELANNIIASATSEQDAVQKAEAIEDVNMADSVLSRVKKHYSQEEHFKNIEQKESLNGFYNKAVQAAQNGESLSYDDIPDNLDPQDKLALMNYINTNGQPETDNHIWESLYDMQVNNAQGFVNTDLNKYRGFLSDGEYKQFLKAQEEIKSGKFYSNIKDDDKMIQAALKEIKLDKNSVMFWGGDKKDIAFSEIRAMTREFEARKGRKITDEELLNLTKSLGYKGSDGVLLYKHIERGMAERTGFIKDVMNDFVYYQKQHNGQLPPDEEKYKIIQKRVQQKAQEKRTEAQDIVNTYTSNALTMKNIAYTTPKPNEQKVLTYFADNQIPTIGNQLGLNLTVTSRYRNQAGSHHAEGRAADVSMSEHSPENRRRIYERLLALPTVYKIGTSDPDILAHFKGNNKIKDETLYDRQHGTNHRNHAHITLINANPATPAKVNSGNVYQF